MSQKVIPYNQLTNEQVMSWLIANDPEGDWEILGAQSDDLQKAVEDNLFDFGSKLQHGDIRVTFLEENE